METIFDHNVTPDEIKKLFGNPSITKEEYLSFGLSKNQHLAGIYKLYMFRKQEKRAKEYLDRLPNTSNKRFTLCNHDFAT